MNLLIVVYSETHETLWKMKWNTHQKEIEYSSKGNGTLIKRKMEHSQKKGNRTLITNKMVIKKGLPLSVGVG